MVSANPASQANQQPRPSTAAHVQERIILRSLPKVLFLYPTLIAALAAGFVTRYSPGHERAIGLAFLIVFFLNMIVFSFDFPRSTSLVVFFAVVAIVLGAILINEHVNHFLPRLSHLIGELAPRANAQFYWIIAGGLGVIFLFVLIAGIRFDYWEIDGNQVVHHHGLWHGVEHYSTAGMRVEVEVIDIFELLLMGSGRLIICLPNQTPVVLENVRRIRRREQQLQPLLDRLNVEVVGHDQQHHAPISN